MKQTRRQHVCLGSLSAWMTQNSGPALDRLGVTPSVRRFGISLAGNLMKLKPLRAKVEHKLIRR